MEDHPGLDLSSAAAATPADPVPAPPSVRRFAREQGIDLVEVPGSGPAGRISLDDVQDALRNRERIGREDVLPSPLDETPVVAAVSSPAETSPTTDGAPAGGESEVMRPADAVRHLVADDVSHAWSSIPHGYHHAEADLTVLEQLRRRYQQAGGQSAHELAVMAFAVKAAVTALRRYPRFNAAFAEGSSELELRDEYTIGVAVETPEGLVAPVIREANGKSIVEIAAEIGTLEKRGRAGALSAADWAERTFTVTYLGGPVGPARNPLITAPEVAVFALGLSRSEDELGENGGAGRAVPLCLGCDRRVIDEVEGARFLGDVVALLSNPIELLLA